MRYTSTLFWLFLCVIVFAGSCKFNPDIQGRGALAFQGVWENEPLKFKDSLLQVTSYQFKFTCDSFYVSLTTDSKVNYYEDSCFNKGQWKEYAKGIYSVSHDTLYLNGTFTKENFRQKLSGCYRIGQYLPVFLVKKTSGDSIELLDLEQHIPVTLKIKEKIICNPQPL